MNLEADPGTYERQIHSNDILTLWFLLPLLTRNDIFKVCHIPLGNFLLGVLSPDIQRRVIKRDEILLHVCCEWKPEALPIAKDGPIQRKKIVEFQCPARCGGVDVERDKSFNRYLTLVRLDRKVKVSLQLTATRR